MKRTGPIHESFTLMFVTTQMVTSFSCEKKLFLALQQHKRRQNERLPCKILIAGKDDRAISDNRLSAITSSLNTLQKYGV